MSGSCLDLVLINTHTYLNAFYAPGVINHFEGGNLAFFAEMNGVKKPAWFMD